MSEPTTTTAQSETGRITRLLLKHPRDAFISQKRLDADWQSLNYPVVPSYQSAVTEYDAFVELLAGDYLDIQFLPPQNELSIDSIYVRDCMIATDGGVILCRMGKEARSAEPEAAGRFLTDQDIPILGAIQGDGRLEGGDLIWLDQRTLVVGQGYRTNAEGIRQLKELTEGLIDELVIVPLPHWNGSGDVMHLMSNISPIDKDLALVYSRLLSVPFRQYLVDRGITLVEVPDEEYDSMGCNVLSLGQRRCLMLEGNPITLERLEEQGVTVITYRGDEISRKGAGGPTCLTRPLLRTTDSGE